MPLKEISIKNEHYFTNNSFNKIYLRNTSVFHVLFWSPGFFSTFKHDFEENTWVRSVQQKVTHYFRLSSYSL